jgi:hypothetical protein
VPAWPKDSYPEGGVHYRFFDVMLDPEIAPLSLGKLRLLPDLGDDRRPHRNPQRHQSLRPR